MKKKSSDKIKFNTCTIVHITLIRGMHSCNHRENYNLQRYSGLFHQRSPIEVCCPILLATQPTFVEHCRFLNTINTCISNLSTKKCTNEVFNGVSIDILLISSFMDESAVINGIPRRGYRISLGGSKTLPEICLPSHL